MRKSIFVILITASSLLGIEAFAIGTAIVVGYQPTDTLIPSSAFFGLSIAAFAVAVSIAQTHDSDEKARKKFESIDNKLIQIEEALERLTKTIGQTTRPEAQSKLEEKNNERTQKVIKEKEEK